MPIYLKQEKKKLYVVSLIAGKKGTQKTYNLV